MFFVIIFLQNFLIMVNNTLEGDFDIIRMCAFDHFFYDRDEFRCCFRLRSLNCIINCCFWYDKDENKKLTNTAKDLCVFLNSKGSLQNFDNDYCMADVLFYITSGLEQEVPELVERIHELTIECNKLLPHGLA